MKQKIATTLLSCCLLVPVAQAEDLPKYLQLARDFVANTKPENNAYTLGKSFTRMPGDLFASSYVVSADCSGFVEEMFRRGDSTTLNNLATQKFKNRHSIHDWYRSILQEEAFTRITKVTDLKPGDVAVWLYKGSGQHHTPGHMLLLDSVPVKIKPRKPMAEGLDQYEFALIDTSQEAKSRDDTRFVSDEALRDENEAKGKERGTVASPNYKGVGRGHIRFYADSEGNLKGAAFSFPKAKFHGVDNDWDIVVGRPRTVAIGTKG